MKLPWGLSEPPAPGTAGVPNVPSPEGRELGAHIARFVDQEEARLRRQFPKLPPRCNDCAGLAGTAPNACARTGLDLVKCAVEGIPFYCHKGVPQGEEPNVLCRAFLALASDDFRERLRRMIADAEDERPRRITETLFATTRHIIATSFAAHVAAHGGRR